MNRCTGIGIVLALVLVAQPAFAQSPRERINALVAMHAQATGVPESLIHRVIVRESRYNPRAIGKGGAMGLMQIKHATARGMGYSGSAAGLLDAETNIKYAVRYLAGAYRVARGNHDRAVALYARGYYYDAKRAGMTHLARWTGPAEPAAPAASAPFTVIAAPGQVVVPGTPVAQDTTFVRPTEMAF
jgi:soluble lytic murein transglycosylase-like protein